MIGRADSFFSKAEVAFGIFCGLIDNVVDVDVAVRQSTVVSRPAKIVETVAVQIGTQNAR
ncbi:hypothetical protein DP42_4657 [Burkholderia pseudomallei]|nr:hypothetical protein DO73_3483 [Burkholderia pseudomallei]KGD19528.1 hypothetical protein DP42_4657 [Burkholderia pseudomallei]